MFKAEGKVTWKGCHPRDRMLGKYAKTRQGRGDFDKNGSHEAQLPKVNGRGIHPGVFNGHQSRVLAQNMPQIIKMWREA